jgi:hypothetical protein
MLDYNIFEIKNKFNELFIFKLFGLLSLSQFTIFSSPLK